MTLLKYGVWQSLGLFQSRGYNLVANYAPLSSILGKYKIKSWCKMGIKSKKELKSNREEYNTLHKELGND